MMEVPSAPFYHFIPNEVDLVRFFFHKIENEIRKELLKEKA